MRERTPDAGAPDLATEAPEPVVVDLVVTGPDGAAQAGAGAMGVAVPAGGAFRKKRLGITFWLSVGWLVLIVGLAVLASVLPLDDPTDFAGRPNQPPSGDHLLGTDTLGRDILSRLAHGGRVSLSVGFMSISMGLLVGGLLGVVAGYFRGRIETVVMGAMEVLLAFPALILSLSIVTFLAAGQPSIWHVTLAIGFLSIAPIARIIRASTLTFAQREFVLAARTLGAKHWRVIRREILPNVLPPAISFALIAVAVAIVAEGTLAFLGLSLEAPTPTWGGMINEGRQGLRESPHVSLVPSCAMFVTVLALNLVGDGLTSRFDVRESRL